LVRVIDTYLMRYDFENIKTVLRAKYTKSEGEAEDLLIAAGCLRRPFFLKLLKEESIEAALEKNCLVDFKKIKQAYDKFKNSNVLGEIENAFDAEYYSYLFGLATKIPKQGKQFRDFLESELEVVNIMNVFRLKRAGVSKADALSYLLPVSRVMKQKLTKLLDAEISEAQTIFLMTPYAKLVEEGLESLQRTGSLIEMETKLKSYLLKKTTMLIREHPLSVDVILGYMFAKDMEVRNLKLMLKGKQLGLDDAFIESQLVV
ncbi:V-type ATPase subunit, partial [Candidatus Woesearchaeota archaeon]|nr:V-type ATPase subunit [Candidatus Woesearchaeota archaeon]